MGGGGGRVVIFFFFNKLSPLSYRILSDEKNFAAHIFLQVDNLKHPLPKDKFYTNLIIYCIDRSKISFKLWFKAINCVWILLDFFQIKWNKTAWLQNKNQINLSWINEQQIICVYSIII